MQVIIIAVLCLFAAVSADSLDWGEKDQDVFTWEAPHPEDAAAPKPCCTPDQWEGKMVEHTAYYSFRHHHPGLLVLGAIISYDGKSKKVAVTAKVARHPTVKLIMDYSKNKTYLIFPKKKRCKVCKTRRPFRKACIPKDAQYTGSFFQGAGGAKLNENVWYARKHGFSATVTVTKTGCIPIGEYVMGHARGTLVASSLGYVNVTAGIKDPKVFTPPSYCKSVDEEDLNVGEEYPILEYIRSKFQEE